MLYDIIYNVNTAVHMHRQTHWLCNVKPLDKLSVTHQSHDIF